MLATEIIRKPLVTEKTTFASGEMNRYAFLVNGKATKPQIRKAIQDLYGVRVLDVATQNKKGRFRRYRYGLVELPTIKRAVVKVHPEDKIELL